MMVKRRFEDTRLKREKVVFDIEFNRTEDVKVLRIVRTWYLSDAISYILTIEVNEMIHVRRELTNNKDASMVIGEMFISHGGAELQLWWLLDSDVINKIDSVEKLEEFLGKVDNIIAQASRGILDVIIWH